MQTEKYVVVKEVDFINEIFNKSKLEYIFTKRELEKTKNWKINKSLASRYLIKKCIFDHLSCKRNFKEIEILNTEQEKPYIKLFGSVDKARKDSNIKSIICSISHSRTWIAALIVFSY